MSGRPLTPKDSDPFGDKVIRAWEMTTRSQREMVMDDWSTGRQIYHIQVADLLHLDPDALRLACFLEFAHPSVCKPSGRPRGNHYGKLCEMMKNYPVDNLPKTVDNSPETVDNSVEIPVDKNASYPQDEGYPQPPSLDAMELSTYPHFIHIPPVDKIT